MSTPDKRIPRYAIAGSMFKTGAILCIPHPEGEWVKYEHVKEHLSSIDPNSIADNYDKARAAHFSECCEADVKSVAQCTADAHVAGLLAVAGHSPATNDRLPQNEKHAPRLTEFGKVPACAFRDGCKNEERCCREERCCGLDASSERPILDWLREHAPDCGDNSCLFGGRGKGGMRTNGGCRCFKDVRPDMKRVFIERMWNALALSATKDITKG